MVRVRETVAFERWFSRLKDPRVQARLLLRLRRLSNGHWGDAKPLGGEVIELREHFGPGWRIYCYRQSALDVLVLIGGVKKTQAADIRRAKILVQEARKI